jgi:CheY-like chemotaxis protein
VVSTDESRQRALQSGAIGFLTKPLQSIDEVDAALGHLMQFAERATKRLLVLMPESEARAQLLACLDSDTDVTVVAGAAGARAALQDGTGDCVVVDAAVAEFGPADVAEALEDRPAAVQLPVVLYLGAVNGSGAPQQWAQPHAGFALREARSPNRLLDAAAFFLHRGLAAMTEQERDAVNAVHEADKVLQGRKVLIVDDDMRNIFALATVLDEHGMTIVSADNGHAAIRLVETDPSIDIVLMDIMMPEMDGMETTREMRKLERGRQLPIIAVTAKAMKGDREKCIAAGAWDYLSKPVETSHLLAVLRGWLAQ